MKQILLFFITICICVNAYGQDTYIGKLSVSETEGVARYMLNSNLNSYALSLNDNFVDETLIIDGIQYFEGDTVAITGMLKPVILEYIVEDFYLEIESITKWIPNQDVQRFLGHYSLDGMCKDISDDVYYPFDHEIGVTITKGIKPGLIINIFTVEFDAFMIDDSLIIPSQWIIEFDNRLSVFSGNGKIENDTLLFRYGEGGWFGVFDCECKGTKMRYSDSITVIPPNATTDDEIQFVAHSRQGDCTLELQIDSTVNNTVYISGKYDGSNNCKTGNGRNDTISLGSEFEPGTYTIVYSSINTQEPETAEIKAASFEITAGIPPIIPGCMDETAENYNPNATIANNDLCEYEDVGMETLPATSLQIFPNPTNRIVTISGAQSQTVEIYDNAGRFVGAYGIHPNNTIDISHLPNGVYFIQINGERVTVVKQ